MDAIKDLAQNTHMDLIDLGTGSAATVDDLNFLHTHRKYITEKTGSKMKMNSLDKCLILSSVHCKHKKN